MGLFRPPAKHEIAAKINEHHERRGQRLEDVTIGQLRDICESIHR